MEGMTNRAEDVLRSIRWTAPSSFQDFSVDKSRVEGVLFDIMPSAVTSLAYPWGRAEQTPRNWRRNNTENLPVIFRTGILATYTHTLESIAYRKSKTVSAEDIDTVIEEINARVSTLDHEKILESDGAYDTDHVPHDRADTWVLLPHGWNDARVLAPDKPCDSYPLPARLLYRGESDTEARGVASSFNQLIGLTVDQLNVCASTTHLGARWTDDSAPDFDTLSQHILAYAENIVDEPMPHAYLAAHMFSECDDANTRKLLTALIALLTSLPTRAAYLVGITTLHDLPRAARILRPNQLSAWLFARLMACIPYTVDEWERVERHAMSVARTVTEDTPTDTLEDVLRVDGILDIPEDVRAKARIIREHAAEADLPFLDDDYAEIAMLLEADGHNLNRLDDIINVLDNAVAMSRLFAVDDNERAYLEHVLAALGDGEWNWIVRDMSWFQDSVDPNTD